MLSIHNNLSAGTQNVTGAYIIIMLGYRRLLTIRLQGNATSMVRQIAFTVFRGLLGITQPVVKSLSEQHFRKSAVITIIV